MVRQRYAADPKSVMEARRFVLAQLPDAEAELRDAVSLMVSELATNAVLHARTEFVVCLEVTDEWLRVEVIDQGSEMPQRQPIPPPTAEHGRGLADRERALRPLGHRRHGRRAGKDGLVPNRGSAEAARPTRASWPPRVRPSGDACQACPQTSRGHSPTGCRSFHVAAGHGRVGRFGVLEKVVSAVSRFDDGAPRLAPCSDVHAPVDAEDLAGDVAPCILGVQVGGSRAMSAGVPARPRGTMGPITSTPGKSPASSAALAIGVSTRLGAIELTVTP